MPGRIQFSVEGSHWQTHEAEFQLNNTDSQIKLSPIAIPLPFPRPKETAKS